MGCTEQRLDTIIKGGVNRLSVSIPSLNPTIPTQRVPAKEIIKPVIIVTHNNNSHP